MLTTLLLFEELKESAVKELAELDGVSWLCWFNRDLGMSYGSPESRLHGDMHEGAGEQRGQLRDGSYGMARGGTS